MRSKFSVLMLLFCTSLSLQALDLKPIPAGQNSTFEGADEAIPCDKLVEALDDLSKKMNAHESSLTAFLSQVSGGLRSWHAQLSPLENTAQTIPVGTFSVLEDAATKTDDITNIAMDNTEFVSNRMNRIVGAARTCSITTPVKAPALK